MKLDDLKQLAIARGVKPAGRKMDIIREIQTAEGFQACFGTRVVDDCPEMSCLWRPDCLQHARAV